MRRALRRAATSRRIVILSALLLIVGPVGGTWAYFSASTVSATSQFTGGYVSEASAGSVAPSGYDAALSWTKATHVDAVTGQTVTYTDRNTTSNCTGATYASSLGSVGTGTSFTSSGATSALNGHYVCLKLVTSDNNWSSQGYIFPIAHLGLFPTSIAISATGTRASQADAGDKITITFNQNISATGIPANNATIDVCFVSSTIIIGDTRSGGCSASTDTFNVGKITGMTFTGSFNANTSIFTFSGATMTITLNTTGSGANSHSGNITTVTSGVIAAATTVKSLITTDQASACTAAANGCTPAATGSW